MKKIYLDTVDSTNNYAKENNFKNKTVIYTFNQTKGRGRSNKSFFSNNGLYFTIVINEDFDIDKIHLLTQIAAVSVFNALKDLGVITNIKWPNDIMYDDKKLCGILTELITNEKKELIVGIGINIYKTEFPTDIKDIAISLEDIIKINFEREKLLDEVLKYFFFYYEEFKKNDYNKIYDIIKNNSYLVGKIIYNKSLNIKGKVMDINEDFSLKVLKDDGNFVSISVGEIYDFRN